MAVVLLNPVIKTFLGLAADAKPTTGVPAGSTFLETDSGTTYVYDGAAWTLRIDLGPFRASKTITFTGAADLGAIGNVPLFTVTGEVLIVVLTATGLTTLVGGTGTLALGVTGNTVFFIGATLANDIAAADYWIDTTPTEVNALAVPAGFKDIWLTENILGSVATAAITAGALRVDVYWRPLSANGNVVAA